LYRLKLLGGVLLDGPDGPVVGRATQQRRLALLALVGSAGDSGRSRDQLIALLWPETDASEARQHLSHSLYALRQSLGEDAIRAAGEYVRLASSRIEVDSLIFENALEAGDRERAADAYAGPFLDGFFIDDAPEFERWVDEERHRLAKLYIQAVQEAGEEADRAGDVAESIKWWGRLVDQDPYNSAAVVRLMETLCTAGDPANALLVASEHRTRLDDDLGVEPTEEVEALSARIQRGELSGRRRSGEEFGAPGISEAGPTLAPSRRPWNRRRAWLTGGVAVIALAAVWILGERSRFGEGIPTESVAVVPFMNLTGDPSIEYLVDGVTDQLISGLARVPNLKVPAQTSSFHYKDRPMDVRAIGDSLGARKLLEGSVTLAGTGLRITAQLIDALTGYHLWTETYERQRGQLHGIHDEIIRGALGALDIDLTVWSSPPGAGTQNPVAWDDYARARHWWSKRTPAGTDSAVKYFRLAVEEDPSWALAWSGLADAHITGMFWGHLPGTDSVMVAVRAMAERAVRLDSTLAEARTSYGAMLSDIRRSKEEAAVEFARAIELNPNYSVARQWYGETLFMWLGRHEEGLRELRRAHEIDPLSPIIAKVLADFLWWSPGGAEDAVRFYNLAVNLEPDHWSSHSNKAIALACLGRDDEARAALDGLLEVGSGFSRAMIDAADILAILRDYDRAGDIIDGIRESDPDPVEFTSDIEGVFARIAINIYVEQGRYSDAMEEYRRLADLISGHSPNTLALVLAWIYARSGDEEASRTVLESVPADRRPRLRAGVLAALGDHDEALDILERTVAEQGVLWELACLGVDPDFDAVREGPVYIRLMEHIGQPIR